MAEQPPTSAAPRRDVCGCEILTDDEGEYADCRDCEGSGIVENGHPCPHCDGVGHHSVGGGVVSN